MFFDRCVFTKKKYLKKTRILNCQPPMCHKNIGNYLLLMCTVLLEMELSFHQNSEELKSKRHHMGKLTCKMTSGVFRYFWRFLKNFGSKRAGNRNNFVFQHSWVLKFWVAQCVNFLSDFSPRKSREVAEFRVTKLCQNAVCNEIFVRKW